METAPSLQLKPKPPLTDEQRRLKRERDRDYHHRVRKLRRREESYNKKQREWNKKHAQRNPDYDRQQYQRRKNNPNFLLRKKLRGRLRAVFQEKLLKKNYSIGPFASFVGCSGKRLVAHFEKHFQPGMTWANYGLWHIDHIIPLSCFDLTNPAQARIANHFTNLRPLWARDNIAKGATIPDKLNHAKRKHSAQRR